MSRALGRGAEIYGAGTPTREALERLASQPTALVGTTCPVLQDIRSWAEKMAPAIGEAQATYHQAQLLE
ncbi:hypothetical protein ABT121_27780 [Streptomyces sp. NPDC001928]|uniref:hypothetical protein n=1 Tax=Streptomyces sp. NPDC001928 TaxID=3154404 RepID=UPI00331C2E1A